AAGLEEQAADQRGRDAQGRLRWQVVRKHVRHDEAGREAPEIAPLLELADATVVRGGTRVLNRVSLTIHAGEHTAILGPNGAGKSSLIRLLTLEDYPVAPAPLDTARGGPSDSHGPGAPAPLRWFGESRIAVADLRKRLGIVTA